MLATCRESRRLRQVPCFSQENQNRERKTWRGDTTPLAGCCFGYWTLWAMNYWLHTSLMRSHRTRVHNKAALRMILCENSTLRCMHCLCVTAAAVQLLARCARRFCASASVCLMEQRGLSWWHCYSPPHIFCYSNKFIHLYQSITCAIDIKQKLKTLKSYGL